MPNIIIEDEEKAQLIKNAFINELVENQTVEEVMSFFDRLGLDRKK